MYLMLLCRIVIDKIHHGLTRLPLPLPLWQAHGTQIWHIQQKIMLLRYNFPLFHTWNATVAMRVRHRRRQQQPRRLRLRRRRAFSVTHLPIYKSLGLAWFGLVHLVCIWFGFTITIFLSMTQYTQYFRLQCLVNNRLVPWTDASLHSSSPCRTFQVFRIYLLVVFWMCAFVNRYTYWVDR